MRRGAVSVAVALAACLVPVAGVASGEGAIASLEVGEAAFWEGTDRAPVDRDGVFERDYPLEIATGGSLLSVGLDRRDSTVRFEVVDPSGKVHAAVGGYRGWQVFVDDPEPGTWIVRARHRGTTDSAPFRFRARLEDAPAPKPDPPVTQLPNLRMVPPHEFTFFPAPSGGLRELGMPNCSAQEVAEEGARSCLRFSLGPINDGAGPLLIRFAPLEGLVTAGKAYQRVYDSNGAYTEREAGTYEYHKTHMHYHHSGFGTLELFRVLDADTGELQLAGTGPKQGFCTADVLMSDWTGFTQPRDPIRSGCAYDEIWPTTRPIGTTMALNRGWADLYSWEQDGNYVEFPARGQGSGLWVVRAAADSRDWILETDESDNVSYAFIRVQDGSPTRIQVLERGFGRDPWDPSKRVVTDDRLPPLADI